MHKAIKSALALAASVAVVAGITAPSAVLAWGDNSGLAEGRRSYTVDQINHGVLGNKIVFNSISNSVDGDEKNFVSARAADAARGTYYQGNNITVENNKEYTIRVYVHNNNPGGLDAVARDTKVAISIPQTSGKQVQVNGFIQSSNATPSKYWDYVNFNSENNAFHLEYVYGSAVFYNNGIGKADDGYPLGDDVVTKATSGGQTIGFEKLDGNIPGCYWYDSYLTIKVKAVYDTDYLIEQKVRKAGTKEWAYTTAAEIGDEVEFQVQYKNLSKVNETQENVMIKAIMPNNMTYVPGTTKIWNDMHSGATVNPDGDLFTRGINIGDYAPNANAYIRFTAKVVDKDLRAGSNTLVNWMQGGVGKITIQDYATVTLTKEGTPDEDPVEYKVTVNYIYEDGAKAADSYHGSYREGDSFTVSSPVIAGYTPDQAEIKSTMGKADQVFTVTYRKASDQPDPTPEDTPSKPQQETPSNLPNTGASGVAAALIAGGSAITGMGVTIMRRKDF